MKFEVTILGSGAALPKLGRNPSSQFINCNERYILIDCAEGTQLQMRRFQVKFQKIHIILISHLHGDHFFGLAGLISSMHLMGRTQKLLIFGPEDLEKLIRPLLEIGGHRLNFELVFTAIQPTEKTLIWEDKLLTIHSFPLKHRIPCYGYQIAEKQQPGSLNKAYFDELGLSLTQIPALKEGKDLVLQNGTVIPNKDLVQPAKKPKSYCYCSDTMYWEKLIPFVEGSEVLYHEATFSEEHKERAKATFHATAKQAAQIAQAAQVGRLLLGHFSSRYDTTHQHLVEAQGVFPASYCVSDGDCIEI